MHPTKISWQRPHRNGWHCMWWCLPTRHCQNRGNPLGESSRIHLVAFRNATHQPHLASDSVPWCATLYREVLLTTAFWGHKGKQNSFHHTVQAGGEGGPPVDSVGSCSTSVFRIHVSEIGPLCSIYILSTVVRHKLFNFGDIERQLIVIVAKLFIGHHISAWTSMAVEPSQFLQRWKLV